MMLFPADSFFVYFFFQFLDFFEFLSSFYVSTVEPIIFGNKNNDDGQDFGEFTADCLFTSISFIVNHDPSSSLLHTSKGPNPN
jgi:hypothetical protein